MMLQLSCDRQTRPSCLLIRNTTTTGSSSSSNISSRNSSNIVNRCSRVRRGSLVAASSRLAAATDIVDVAVVGSGIIGLCIAKKLLEETDLSVALLDIKQPTAGATGAGQGYIWMAHRDPSSPGWALAKHSKAAWEALAAPAAATAGQGSSSSNSSSSGSGLQQLATAMEFQATGSLLLATTDQEVAQLQQRAAMLQQKGIPGVVLLRGRELHMLEPALQLPPGSEGLLVRSDAQINGKQTAYALLDYCQHLSAADVGSMSGVGSSSSSSRMLLGLHEGVVALEPAAGSSSSSREAAVDVVTNKRRIRARKGVVIAAGVWSGQLLAAATGNGAWQQLLQPRRGHLVELTPPPGMPKVSTGMMELSYTQHYSSSSSSNTSGSGGNIVTHNQQQQQQQQSLPGESGGDVDITFTATTSASGTLLLGSSREFSGWEAAPSTDIIAAIMSRAATFLPALSAIQPHDLLDTTRVGLRPFAVGGLPAVGMVPGLPGVAVAAGHEGSGLTLGPATADVVLHQLLGLEIGGAGGGAADELLAAAEQLLPQKRLEGCL